MSHTALTVLLTSALAAAPGRADDRVDFAHDVLPLLKQHCSACHTHGTYKGGLSMDTREALLKSDLVVPGQSAESILLDYVTEPDPALRMPPQGPPLTEAQVAVLRRWIDQGLPWQEGFSFAKAGAQMPLLPRRPGLPPAREGRTHPVDRLVDAYFERQHVPPPSPLEDATFLRRTCLDIVGLLPTPEQLEEFLADPAPDKRQRLVHRLLAADQDYAEHWLTFWNDLLRNDYEGTGYIDGGRKAITAWLYRSLRENAPYDRLVRELISPTPESEGFILGIQWRGAVNASQVPEVQFAQNVAQVFLGINLKCASCHDSFIDAWKLEDAYGLAAVVAETPPEIHRCDKPTGVQARAKFLFPELGQVDATGPRQERLRQLAELMTSPDNGLLTRTVVNRLWHRLMGRGIVHPVDVMSNEPWSADLIDFLASDLADHGYDLKRTIALVVTSRAYQSQSVAMPGEAMDEDYVFRGPIARRMTAEQFVDAVWRLTGTAPAEPAARLERRPTTVRASLVTADALMRSLGRPNREQVVSTRPEDLSTLQALDLTNGQDLADLLARGAQGLRGRHPDWDHDRLTTWIFLGALGRRPTPAELETAREILQEPISNEGVSDLLWTVVMLPEFQLIR